MVGEGKGERKPCGSDNGEARKTESYARRETESYARRHVSGLDLTCSYSVLVTGHLYY